MRFRGNDVCELHAGFATAAPARSVIWHTSFSIALFNHSFADVSGSVIPPVFQILTTEITTQPTTATIDPLHHEGHEGVFLNVFITLRGVGAVRG